MKIVLTESSNDSLNQFNNHIQSYENNTFFSSNCFPLFDKPILIRNIELLNSLYKIESILIPQKLNSIYTTIKAYFDIPTITIDNKYYHRIIKAGNHIQSKFPKVVKKKIQTEYQNFFNLQHTNPDTKNFIFLSENTLIEKTIEDSYIFNNFSYPWEFLKIVQGLLNQEIQNTIISRNAKIAQTAIIEGPCIIGDNVTVDDFAKIKGPAYIGNGSFIGMGSLVRNSMLNYNTNIGYNCEIAKSYFVGNSKISHHNVILDSIIGRNVWFGGYSGTANVLLTRKNIKYKINDQLIDTGENHFGAVVSNDSSIGASVIILPGRKILPNSIIPAGTIFSG